MKEKHIGYEVHMLDHMIGRMISLFRAGLDEKAGITQMQGWIISYLYRNSDTDVFQKDLEAEFHIARSTATGILQLMEKKGLITREPIPRDARLKRLLLTDKALDFQKEIIENFDKLDLLLRDNIPPEKLDTFFDVAEQIRNNITNHTDRKENPNAKNTIGPGQRV